MQLPPTGPFEFDQLVMIVDLKNRRHVQRLRPGNAFHSHAGLLTHDEIVGMVSGAEARTTKHARLRVWRPTLADYIFTMKRGAQIIYPKDLGAIVLAADLYPGLRVFESGVGSGALSLAALNAIGPSGIIHGYEIREDFQAQAIANVEGWFGPCPNYRIESRSSYDGIELESIDRALLDLPEPWHVVPHLEQCLVPGGVMVSYLPTITQTAQLRQTLETLAFSEIRSLEVLHRGWHIEGLSVRPDHRMVAHTGFLTVARRAEPSGSV
jgi:tRNA (adenine57-N1/adenine58-N1)-methyltransferase